MKKLLLACVVTVAGFAAMGSASFADINENMKDSKYCTEGGNSGDPLCMGPEMTATRANILSMTKEKTLENRSKYCENKEGEKDLICDPKTMKDETGFN
jgi:hypothetical protein